MTCAANDCRVVPRGNCRGPSEKVAVTVNARTGDAVTVIGAWPGQCINVDHAVYMGGQGHGRIDFAVSRMTFIAVETKRVYVISMRW